MAANLKRRPFLGSLRSSISAVCLRSFMLVMSFVDQKRLARRLGFFGERRCYDFVHRWRPLSIIRFVFGLREAGVQMFK